MTPAPRTFLFFFFNDPAPPEISPLSLPDALPISFQLARLALPVDQDRRHENEQQHDRERRGDRPVAVAEEFEPQDLPDHRGGRRAEQIGNDRSEEHTSELQSLAYLVCRLLLEKKK